MHYPEGSIQRERVLPLAPVGRSPRFLAGFVMTMMGALLKNWARPSRDDVPPQGLLVRNLVWFRVMGSDCLAVETHWDRELSVFRRNRANFRHLLTVGLRATWRLRCAEPTA